MITVYQFGGFDIANYGDLLFPLLAEKRLSSLGVKIVAVSPIGSEPVWGNCLPSVGIDRIVSVSGKPSAVLIGGGDILTLLPTKLPAYNQGSVHIFAYPDIWIGASCFADGKVPVCWNAPGVPRPFSEVQRGYVRDCIDRSSYVSVRDEQSRNFLLEAYPDAEISVVPDTAWDISNLWTTDELEETYERVFSCRGERRPARSIVVHLKSQVMFSCSEEVIAGWLDEVSRKFDVKIFLVAFGPCHGDDKLAIAVGSYMKTSPLIVDKPNSLREIASCIAHAQMYVGCSMHGLITASSFCIPGICVSSETPKFKGLQQQLGCAGTWSESWETVPRQICSMNMDQKKAQLRELRQRMQERVDQHWEQIKAIIKEYSKNFDDRADRTVNASYKANKRFFSYRANFAAVEAIKNIYLYDQAKIDLAENDRVIAEKDRAIAHYREELYGVYTSRSWRYTAPLRKIGTLVRRVLRLLHKSWIRAVIKRAYFLLPPLIRNSRFVENLKNRFKSKEIIN